MALIMPEKNAEILLMDISGIRIGICWVFTFTNIIADKHNIRKVGFFPLNF